MYGITSTNSRGGAIFALLLAGYITQRYGLPPPAPKIAGIDLGTTFSSIGIYHAVTGETTVVKDKWGKMSIPSVVAFLENGTVLVGTAAVKQQEKNPTRTIYDAKRFIGRTYEAKNHQLHEDQKRYPFKLALDSSGHAYIVIPLTSGDKILYPEEIGAIIIKYLREAVETHTKSTISQAVISVPAEFEEAQRNATAKAAALAGIEARRVVSEPTAAALAYGLHKKKGVENIVVVDLGGGTLDVSVLWLQSGVFVTQAMAGNNRLGGQDFNERVQKRVLEEILRVKGQNVVDKEDLQQIRMAVEDAKVTLTTSHSANIALNLKDSGRFQYKLTREEFESLNEDLLISIIEPIEAALEDANLKTDDVDEIVLVGGSTRIPRVRQIVGQYFNKVPNYGVDPELAVVTGAAVQAGVIGGGWPLQVAAMELPTKRRKRHFYTEQQREDEEEL